MTLGSTKPLTEMSTRNIFWEVKAAGSYGWQPYHFHVLIILKSGIFKLLETSGLVQGCDVIALPLPTPAVRLTLLNGRIQKCQHPTTKQAPLLTQIKPDAKWSTFLQVLAKSIRIFYFWFVNNMDCGCGCGAQRAPDRSLDVSAFTSQITFYARCHLQLSVPKSSLLPRSTYHHLIQCLQNWEDPHCKS